MNTNQLVNSYHNTQTHSSANPNGSNLAGSTDHVQHDPHGVSDQELYELLQECFPVELQSGISSKVDERSATMVNVAAKRKLDDAFAGDSVVPKRQQLKQGSPMRGRDQIIRDVSSLYQKTNIGKPYEECRFALDALSKLRSGSEYSAQQGQAFLGLYNKKMTFYVDTISQIQDNKALSLEDKLSFFLKEAYSLRYNQCNSIGFFKAAYPSRENLMATFLNVTEGPWSAMTDALKQPWGGKDNFKAIKGEQFKVAYAYALYSLQQYGVLSAHHNSAPDVDLKSKVKALKSLMRIVNIQLSLGHVDKPLMDGFKTLFQQLNQANLSVSSDKKISKLLLSASILAARVCGMAPDRALEGERIGFLHQVLSWFESGKTDSEYNDETLFNEFFRLKGGGEPKNEIRILVSALADLIALGEEKSAIEYIDRRLDKVPLGGGEGLHRVTGLKKSVLLPLFDRLKGDERLLPSLVSLMVDVKLCKNLSAREKYLYLLDIAQTFSQFGLNSGLSMAACDCVDAYASYAASGYDRHVALSEGGSLLSLLGACGMMHEKAHLLSYLPVE